MVNKEDTKTLDPATLGTGQLVIWNGKKVEVGMVQHLEHHTWVRFLFWVKAERPGYPDTLSYEDAWFKN